jgi:predicted ABC-type transport system involved in lysophospholipase L1 biosynthesis ATPase subunit
MTVLENVCLPLMLQGEASRRARPRAEAVLETRGASPIARGTCRTRSAAGKCNAPPSLAR